MITSEGLEPGFETGEEGGAAGDLSVRRWVMGKGGLKKGERMLGLRAEGWAFA